MLDPLSTVASTVLDHSETASVFQRHRIDYCCKGGRSIRAACEERGVDLPALIAELDAVIAERHDPRERAFAEMSTSALIVHIVSNHHDTTRRALPFVRALSSKVARVHGEHEPRLRDLAELVRKLEEELVPHLDAEEELLFPAMLAAAADPRVIALELEHMYDEHVELGRVLEEMAHLTDDYTPPEWGCTSYRTLFSELARLDEDLRRHVHLENFVLLPRFA
jgi:regulator of cell morphogenesis and NO signaling